MSNNAHIPGPIALWEVNASRTTGDERMEQGPNGEMDKVGIVREGITTHNIAWRMFPWVDPMRQGWLHPERFSILSGDQTSKNRGSNNSGYQMNVYSQIEIKRTQAREVAMSVNLTESLIPTSCENKKKSTLTSFYWSRLYSIKKILVEAATP